MLEPITILDNFLSSSEISELINRFPEEQYRYMDEEKEIDIILLSRLKERFKNKEITSSGIVSMNSSSIPVALHYDSVFHDENYKLLVYLTTGGSTTFYCNPFCDSSSMQINTLNEIITVDSVRGRAVLFDISLFHRGNNHLGIKKTVGLRVRVH